MEVFAAKRKAQAQREKRNNRLKQLTLGQSAWE